MGKGEGLRVPPPLRGFMIDVLYPIEKQIRLELDNDFSWYRLNQMGFGDEKKYALVDEFIEEDKEYTY